MSNEQAASGDSLGSAGKRGFFVEIGKSSEPAIAQCQFLKRTQASGTLSFRQHAVSPVHVEEIRKEQASLFNPRPSSTRPSAEAPVAMQPAARKLGNLQSHAWGRRPKGKISPPWSREPCLPLQAGEWARGHCSAPTWCEIAPPWHSACIFHGRRLPPPWPVNRHKPLTDPHCSCDGETVSVRRVAGHHGEGGSP